MIEKTIKTIEGKLKIAMPSMLTEVTLGQLMEMQGKPNLNDLEAISILAGISLQKLQNVKNFEELEVFGDTVLTLSQQIKYLYNSDSIPQKITFNLNTGSKIVHVFNNLSIEPAGAFFEAREIIADEINAYIEKYGKDDWEENFKPSLKACCQVLAHYFYCRATGNKYNEYEAESFCTEIKKLRVTEALPVAKHFFTCYPSLSKPKTGYSLRLREFWKKKLGRNASKNLNISTP